MPILDLAFVKACDVELNGCELLYLLAREYLSTNDATHLAALRLAKGDDEPLVVELSLRPPSEFDKPYVEHLIEMNDCQRYDVFARDKACFLVLSRILTLADGGATLEELGHEVMNLYFDTDCPTVLDGRLPYSVAAEGEAGPEALLSGWRSAVAELSTRIRAE